MCFLHRIMWCDQCWIGDWLLQVFVGRNFGSYVTYEVGNIWPSRFVLQFSPTFLPSGSTLHLLLHWPDGILYFRNLIAIYCGICVIFQLCDSNCLVFLIRPRLSKEISTTWWYSLPIRLTIPAIVWLSQLRPAYCLVESFFTFVVVAWHSLHWYVPLFWISRYVDLFPCWALYYLSLVSLQIISFNDTISIVVTRCLRSSREPLLDGLVPSFLSFVYDFRDA